jgi:eukaryotic-like serine/threonine-protein kinase
MRAGSPVAGERLPSWAFAEDAEIVPGRHAVDLLGGGERSEAWLAWDERLHTLVVAKLLRPDQVNDSHARAGLEREARALAALGHPSIVRCFDAVLDGPRPHLVLESLDGPRLSTLLRRYGPLAPEQLVALAIEIGSALAFMHDAGFVHLDVKPRNLIMGATPKLIDLGIARTFDEVRLLTAPLGTDAYMAPEQTWAETVSSVGPQADAWGLAVTLYEAMEGRLPFDQSEGATDAPYPQRTSRPAPFRRRAAEPIESVITSGLSRDPRTRPPLAEMVSALEPLLLGARRMARRRLRRRVR